MPHPSRTVNNKLCATSIVRPIEAMKPPEPNKYGEIPKNVILKPKPKPKPNKNLPGTKLLIKLARDREKQKSKHHNHVKDLDPNVIDSVIEGILDDLQ